MDTMIGNINLFIQRAIYIIQFDETDHHSITVLVQNTMWGNQIDTNCLQYFKKRFTAKASTFSKIHLISKLRGGVTSMK